MPRPLTHSIFLEPLTKHELTLLLTHLNIKKSSGPDGISPKLIFEIAHEILSPLVYIFNLSIATGTVPDQMKIARVIPIFKHRLKTQTENYRPISLLNVICKLLVKTIYTRVYSYLGPLLFLIYINDIQNSGEYDNLNLFVDDTSLFVFNKNINKLYDKANTIDRINLWFQANKLNLNL